ncbi:two-component hybrid sensor and regulator [Isoalcanivorax pacificus W11-5]|uniref:Two-component hybrid sensor and regulator n=1 Tax=Isoalcanivorax pacificus W11-5 TaxID=391936 RepID=A0A0B4XNM8_9GAMM|nr:Hpt domain-containing protein [Isoalcanivorax pacificus]AJD48711.1 two-component hybrid sensor and regulator [Isoalcanivorax pacificus W11-5]
MEHLPVLDTALVAELRDIMGQDYPMLVAAWRRDATQRLEELTGARQADNREALRRAAHTLKGSSSNLGAARVAGLCALLEQKTMSLSEVEIDSCLVAIDTAVSEAGDALQSTLD